MWCHPSRFRWNSAPVFFAPGLCSWLAYQFYSFSLRVRWLTLGGPAREPARISDAFMCGAVRVAFVFLPLGSGFSLKILRFSWWIFLDDEGTAPPENHGVKWGSPVCARTRFFGPPEKVKPHKKEGQKRARSTPIDAEDDTPELFCMRPLRQRRQVAMLGLFPSW